MNLTLEIGVKQQLSISVQLQQAIALLQLSSQEMLTQIHDAIERNPLLELEEAEPPAHEGQLTNSTNYTGESATNTNYTGFDLDDSLNNTKIPQTLTSHLYAQVILQQLSAKEQSIASIIIDAINNDGYLTMSLDDIHHAITAAKIDACAQDVSQMLTIVQRCDPPGVGARDIRECIILQLQQLNAQCQNTANAIAIIEQHFDNYSKHNHAPICKALNLTTPQFNAAAQLIKNVNPRPGADFTQLINPYITPDVFARKINNQWCVYLNPQNNPTVKLNNQYLTLLSGANNKQNSKYLKDNLKEAKWFINSIENRHKTLLKVAKAIMSYQTEFLEHGIMRMKPLRLATIAEQVQMHESTISRVTTQKYIVTPHGIYELKYFFSSQIRSNSGTSCSSTAIKALIKKIIDEENKNKPLSDNAIMSLLAEHGIKLARRTVTKYREAMSIMSSNERRQTI